MLSMAVMDELVQDLICRLFSIDLVQEKENLCSLTDTSIDHYVEDEYSEGKLFHLYSLTGKWVICVLMLIWTLT